MSEDEPRSGLRNPAAAVRGAGAVALGAEALVMLLAIVPLAVLQRGRAGPAIATVVVIAVAAIALAALLRFGWAWYAAAALPVALFVAGLLLNGALAVLGVIFALAWAYVLSVRRTVLRPPATGRGRRPRGRATG